MGHHRSPAASAQLSTPSGGSASGISDMAARHSLCELSLPGFADPQWSADSHGSSPAILERPLHAPHGVAPADANRSASGSRVDGQGGLALPIALDWIARWSAPGWHGAALAFPQCAVLGGQRRSLCGPAVRHRTVEAFSANVLANCAGRVGLLRPLRYFSFATGAGQFPALQRAAATDVLHRGFHPCAAGNLERSFDVARLDEPVPVVSQAAGKPSDWPV